MVFNLIQLFNSLTITSYVEHHAGNGAVSINRVVNRYYWPNEKVKTRYGYKRGNVLGVFPWVDIVVGFQYQVNGETFDSIKELHVFFPEFTADAERSLLKVLGEQ